MKYLIYLLIFLIAGTMLFSQAVIIYHNCTKLQNVPEKWITKAKQDFIISYGHTSHGSQLVSGMTLLKDMSGSIYQFNTVDGSLTLNDCYPDGDLGSPDWVAWAAKTRDMLNNNDRKINLVMWSWCGQVSWSTEENINTYLNLMNTLEIDFPNVKFVYMTGHLDGTGVDGTLNQRNNQIRQFCQQNNKILFDFADIESYNPDGEYFLDKNADDGCNYTGGNWATEWCDKHPNDCPNCDCAHSQPINCLQKGKSLWWMLARISGWDGAPSGVENEKISNFEEITLYPNPANDEINIISKEQLLQKINIYDEFGCLIMSNTYNSNSIVLDTKNLSNGFYEMKIFASGTVCNKKFIVMHK